MSFEGRCEGCSDAKSLAEITSDIINTRRIANLSVINDGAWRIIGYRRLEDLRRLEDQQHLEESRCKEVRHEE